MSVFENPLSTLGEPITGQMALYRTGSQRYPYFTSGAASSSKAVVLIPGLTSGMGQIPYTAKLDRTLEGAGWKLVQFHWSGAYMGFGTSNLDNDAQEMDDLVKQLAATGMTKVVFLGNSTGCQDIAKYLSTRSHPVVVGGIMQAPVSDREFWAQDTSEAGLALQKFLPEAERAVKEGRGDEIVPKSVWSEFGGRITNERFFSLAGVGGDDDYFSSDIPDDASTSSPHKHPLSTSFGRFSAPALALWSELDDFASPHAAPIAERFERWTAAAPSDKPLRCAVIPGADHEVHDDKAQDVLMQEVLGFIGEVGI